MLCALAVTAAQGAAAREDASADSALVVARPELDGDAGLVKTLDNPLKYRPGAALVRLPASEGWQQAVTVPRFTYQGAPEAAGLKFRLDNVAADVSGNAVLARWETGGVSAYGSVKSFPGMMALESGGLQLSQSVGRVSFAVTGFAEKAGWFRGLTTDYGFGAAAAWQISDRVSLHAFGSFYMRNYAAPMPAMSGLTGSSSYGGFLRYDSESWWGVDVGAQNVYSPSLRRWELMPVVRPYVKVGGHSVGVDVGSIIYSLLHSVGESRGWGGGNPTMGPPVPMGPPPVR